MFGALFRAIFGTKGERDLKRMLPVVERINALEPEIRALSDDQLRARTPEFKRRLAEALGCAPAELPLHGEENEGNRVRLREALDEILPEAFAVVRETAWRIIKQRHYDVQLVGGMVLHQGKIAEMKTGEGKTLAATLPVYLNALTGLGVHLVTVNDYLARRDAEWMGPIYRFHGLSVGYILTNMDQDARQAAYAADITYGTNNEFGFDYLRDNMVPHLSYKAQRGFYFCIVDEVDSILIDEARTPLIISGPAEESTGKYMDIQKIIPRLARGVTIGQDLDGKLLALTDEKTEMNTRLEMDGGDAEAKARLLEIKKEMTALNREKQNATINKQLNVPLTGGDYVVEESDRSVFLTPDGIERVEKLLGIDNLYGAGNIELVHHVEQALKANTLFKLDVDYVVKDGEVVIVDEFTGRLMPGRRYSDGLHQALEAKEGVKVERENQTLATITFQNYFRMYAKLSGMTGTADTEAEEFQKIYKLDVVVIPTNRSVVRDDNADRIYRTEREKNEAIVDEIAALFEREQPVLVGTISVEKSERLSRLLKSRGVPHNVLNAKFHDKEAEIVAEAGRSGRVTIATNMAGRGTDIILGGNPETQGRVLVENLLRNTHRKAGEAEVLEFVRLVRLDQQEMLAAFRAAHPDFDEDLVAQLRRLYEQVKAEQRKVLDAGGLFILGTERHEARRIDNQLRGRSGRQGDPGASRFYISMEDDLMRIFGGERLKMIMQRLGMKEGEEIEHPWISRAIANSQRRVESKNFEIRKHLLKYDEVMNEQRTWVYRRRNQVLEQEDLSELVMETIEDVVAARIEEVSENRRGLSAEALEALRRWIEVDLKIAVELPDDAESLGGNLAQFQENLVEGLKRVYRERESRIGSANMRAIEKFVLLRTIDAKWKEHLYEMDHLKEGVGLRSYAERDPLIEYKFEGFRLFHDMLARVNSETLELLFHVELAPADDIPASPVYAGGQAMHHDVGQFGMLARREAPPQMMDGPPEAPDQARAFRPGARPQPRQQVVRRAEKVGRNSPCPCGSGKKYKHCCYPKYE